MCGMQRACLRGPHTSTINTTTAGAHAPPPPRPPPRPPPQAGGNVVRLVGLYHTQRGAHTYFLRAKEVQRPGDYVVNLIHYEDAARLAVAVRRCTQTAHHTIVLCDTAPTVVGCAAHAAHAVF